MSIVVKKRNKEASLRSISSGFVVVIFVSSVVFYSIQRYFIFKHQTKQTTLFIFFLLQLLLIFALFI